jgi:predicted PurR-regulated permease PerM
MQTMIIRGFPILRFLLGAAAIVIVVFGLKYSSDVLGPILFAATLAILFTPLLRWLDRRSTWRPPGSGTRWRWRATSAIYRAAPWPRASTWA